MKPEYLSIAEAAELVGVNQSTIRRVVNSLPTQTPTHDNKAVVLRDETVKPFKIMILRAWIAEKYELNEKPLPIQPPTQEPTQPEPNTALFERLIAAKDEQILDLRGQVSSLTNALERADILLQTSLKQAALPAHTPPISPPDEPINYPAIILIALAIAFAAATGYVIAQ